MKDNKKYIIAAPILLVLLGLAYYFLYFIKTPSYAVNEIRTAIVQHDALKFQQKVDVDNVLDKAFDDLITAESKINNDNIINNPFALSILHVLKPTVVKLMKEEALEYVANPKEKATKKVNDPVSDAMRRNLKRKAQLDNLTYKEIKLTQNAKDNANVSVILYNEVLKKDFALNLNMLKTQSNGWRINEITNLVDFILQMDATEKAQKANSNKQTLERIKQNIAIMDKHLSVKEEIKEDSTPYIDSQITIKNLSNKNITRVYYDIEVLGKNKKVIYSYPSSYDGSIAANSIQEISSIKQLHSQIPDDRALAALKGKDLDFNITFTYISFSDGSTIEPNIFTSY